MTQSNACYLISTHFSFFVAELLFTFGWWSSIFRDEVGSKRCSVSQSVVALKCLKLKHHIDFQIVAFKTGHCLCKIIPNVKDFIDLEEFFFLLQNLQHSVA